MRYEIRCARALLLAVGLIAGAPLVSGQEPGLLSLNFPVKQNAVCGGVCTPANSPIMTVFDHQMQVAYECRREPADTGA